MKNRQNDSSSQTALLRNFASISNFDTVKDSNYCVFHLFRDCESAIVGESVDIGSNEEVSAHLLGKAKSSRYQGTEAQNQSARVGTCFRRRCEHLGRDIPQFGRREHFDPEANPYPFSLTKADRVRSALAPIRVIRRREYSEVEHRSQRYL